MSVSPEAGGRLICFNLCRPRRGLDCFSLRIPRLRLRLAWGFYDGRQLRRLVDLLNQVKQRWGGF
jgi:hypothetical protein